MTSPRLSLMLLLLPTAVVAVDLNVLFLAVPELTADLGASATQQLWITDVYGLVVGVLAIVAGAVGDRVGRRRLLLIGCAGFLVASVLAAYATTPESLLLARVLQGVAGATLMPSTLALIGDVFPDDAARARAIGTWATCQFAFASLGPVVGGVLLHWFWWGSVFLLAVPTCAVVLVLGRRLLPESRPADRAPRVDMLSAGLLMAALLALFTAVKACIPGSATPVPSAAVAVAVVVAAGVAFVRRQGRLAVPFLDLDLLRERVIVVSVTSLTLVAVVLAGTGFWVTQYLQSVVGLSPLAAAVVFMPMGLGIGAGSYAAPLLARRVDPDVLIPAGLVVAALGALLQLTVSADSAPGYAPMVVAITLTAFGCGPLFAFGTHRVVSSAPPAAAGRAAALAETSNHLGSSLGFAAVGSLATAVFALSLRPLASGFDVGAETVTMAQTRAFAEGSPQRDAVLDAIAVAGTEALHAVGLGTAVLLLCCAALNVRRRMPRRASASPVVSRP
ncbi:MFS transporter [Mumia sp. ZJ430]|uniref:MFS transporter n=1 Tax=Mumia sp. ZJ430 TaxID=2708083 RepID=UPI0014233862|nr:MFS transporter [Mumia sp. ZJ430]